MLKGKKEQKASTGGDIAKTTEEYRQKDKEVKKNCKNGQAAMDQPESQRSRGSSRSG